MSFDSALKITLAHEGGYVDDSADPGGATNFGVTQRVYDDWRVRNGYPKQAVIDITGPEVVEIYHDGFWVPSEAQRINDPIVAAKYFDLCVNIGIAKGCELLQLACGDVGHPTMVDGIPGTNTIASANACNAESLLIALKERAIEYYRDLANRKPQMEKFLRGWLARAES